MKLLLLGAMAVAIIVDCSLGRQTQASLPLKARQRPSTHLDALLQEAERSPSVDIYMQISVAYEQRGEFRQAIRYLRRSDLMAEIEHR